MLASRHAPDACSAIVQRQDMGIRRYVNGGVAQKHPGEGGVQQILAIQAGALVSLRSINAMPAL